MPDFAREKFESALWHDRRKWPSRTTADKNLYSLVKLSPHRPLRLSGADAPEGEWLDGWMVNDIEVIVVDRSPTVRTSLHVIDLWSFSGAAALLARILDPNRHEDLSLHIGKELGAAGAEP